MEILRVENLKKTYGKGNTLVKALDGVSFTVEKGEFVAIVGRALMNRPALLLADEPTGNLDSKASHDIIELLKLSNKKYKQTIIMITHDHSLALNASRIITIDDGKIVSDEMVK